MKTSIRKKLLFLLILFFVISPVFAQRMTVRLASIVPENTPWGQSINRLAAEWNRITNGQVNMIVFHGGTAGDESQVMSLLKSNQLQAGVFTSMGLNSITPEIMVISYPFLIRDDKELDEVLRRVKPDLDARMRQNGFVTLTWVRSGWVKVFSKTPVTTPDDLRRLKFGTGFDDPQLVQAFRVFGYQVVPVNLTEQLFALQSNRIEALYNSPILSAGNQTFGLANNMSTVSVAPFMGGILMNEITWRRIPDRYKPALMEACRRAEKEIEDSIANLEAEAIATMKRHGLKVNELTPAQVQLWYDDHAKYENRLVGQSNPIFHREFYFRVKDILTEYRSGSAQRR